MMKEIVIGNRKIGHQYPPYFIADIAANHDGDIERAYKLIELAKASGADAAKFQNFNASTIVSKQGFEKLGNKLAHQSKWDKSVYEVYQDATLPNDWSGLLKAKCQQVGIEYMTSPYNYEAIDCVDPYVNCYKVGSGDITWVDIINYMAGKHKPILLATGASDLMDVERAYKVIKQHTEDIVIMQCNTNYTADEANFHHINLNVLKQFHQQFPEAILGLSDHTKGHATVAGAIALGARVIEKHFTDDNLRVGPDHKFSMTPEDWKQMVKVANQVFFALGSSVKQVEENERETVHIQRRALYTTKDLKCGHIITEGDLFPLRPMIEGGIEPYSLQEVIGKRLIRDLVSDSALKREDVIGD